LIQRKVVAPPQSAAHIEVMRQFLFAIAVLAGGTSAALAYCPSVPDNAESGYSANQTALALCRQREIADGVRLQQQQAELQGEINQLQLQIRLNDQFARAQQALPPPQF
jgi:TolA-binding protein